MTHWAWYKQSKNKDVPHSSRAQSFFEMLSVSSAVVQMKKNMLKSTMSRPCARERGNRKMCTDSHYPRTLQEEEFKQWYLLHWPPIAWLTKLLPSTISSFRTKDWCGKQGKQIHNAGWAAPPDWGVATMSSGGGPRPTHILQSFH